MNFINTYAFGGCMDLTDLTVFWDSPSEVTLAVAEWPEEDVFVDVDKSTVKLHVPPGTKEAYQVADVWKDFNIADDAVTSSISDEKTVALYLFPNPVSEGFRVTGLESPATLVLTDVSGCRIFYQAISNDEYIDVSALRAGLYLVTISSIGKGVFQDKIVKQ